jgi:hypothetical protein
MIFGGNSHLKSALLVFTMDENTFNFQEMPTEKLITLLAEANKELAKRRPKHPVSILKEWADVKQTRAMKEQYFHRKKEDGWVCVITILQENEVETFSVFVRNKGDGTWTKREAKRSAAVKAVEECSFLKTETTN